MHPQINSLLREAEDHYLKPEELSALNQYVASLPGRMEAYRMLRDREAEIMQTVTNQLQRELPQESVENLERSLRHGILILRHCAMAGLMNDENLVRTRLQNWLPPLIRVYDSAAIYIAMLRLMEQSLNRTLTAEQMELIYPMLQATRSVLMLEEEPLTAAALGW